MTARQPQSPYEAAMLGLTGLRFPAVTAGPQPAGVQPRGLMSPNKPRGLFGASVRRAPFQVGMGSADYMNDADALAPDAASPPPISSAPPPPSDWRKTVGADLMAQLPQTPPQPMLGDALPPAPPMRGGIFGNAAAAPSMPGLALMSDKIGNGGALFGSSREKEREKARDKPGFFDRGGAGVDILGGLADGLAQYFGGQPQYVPAMYKRKQDERNHTQRLQEMAQEWQLRSSQPEYRTINNRLVRYTPNSGEPEVLYTAPEDFQTYAETFGYEPGTPEYDRAVRDFILRGSGDTATENYNVREDHRQENREDLEGIRQGNRIGLQDRRQAGQRALKTTPTYRQANPSPPRAGGRAGGSGGGVREGQTATNPQTGAKVVYRGGKWVPAR